MSKKRENLTSCGNTGRRVSNAPITANRRLLNLVKSNERDVRMPERRIVRRAKPHDDKGNSHLLQVRQIDAQQEHAGVRPVPESDPSVADRRRQTVAARNRNLPVNSKNRCRRSNGTLRAWFGTKAEAVAFAENPINTANNGDIPGLCMKPGCDGWHLSQPHWPDARAAASAWA